MSAPNHKHSFDEAAKGLTEFQHSIHFPEDDSKGPNYPGNGIHSYFQFHLNHRRTTWYYRYSERAERSERVESSERSESSSVSSDVVFKLSTKPHGLFHTHLNQRLPSIVTKPGYVARWTHNVGSNVMITGTIELNDTPLQTKDYVRIDQYHQSMITEDKRSSLDTNLGNLAMLQERSKCLPTYTTCFTIPWFFSETVASYFPLFYCGYKDELVLRLALRSKVSDLLHVYDEKGARAELSNRTIALIDGKSLVEGQTPMMPNPTLFADYAYMTEMELMTYRCPPSPEQKNNPLQIKHSLHIDDTQILDAPEGKIAGSTVVLPIPDSKFPVHSFAWVAQNSTALENGYYSNYSTDANSHIDGWSPILSTDLDDGTGPFIKEHPSYMTERVHPSHYYPCAPREPGFNFWCRGMIAKDKEHKPGTVIKNGKICVKLGDTNPFQGLPGGPSGPTTDKFILKARLDYTKRITFVSFPTDEASRATKGASIKISGV